MKKFIEEHEIFTAVALIVLYIIVNSICLNLFTASDYRTVLINLLFSAGLIFLTLVLKRGAYYGFTAVRGTRAYGYFLPLVLIASVNLWGGFHTELTLGEAMLFAVNMINVAFIEEIIFRGFLFRAMARDNIKAATVVGALTFGVGHAVNLLSGADLIPTLLQICYATAIGFLFVVIFIKSGSLLPCILTHAAVNALSMFSSGEAPLFYITAAVLTVVPVLYAVYILKRVKGRAESFTQNT